MTNDAPATTASSAPCARSATRPMDARERLVIECAVASYRALKSGDDAALIDAEIAEIEAVEALLASRAHYAEPVTITTKDVDAGVELENRLKAAGLKKRVDETRARLNKMLGREDDDASAR